MGCLTQRPRSSSVRDRHRRWQQKGHHRCSQPDGAATRNLSRKAGPVQAGPNTERTRPERTREDDEVLCRSQRAHLIPPGGESGRPGDATRGAATGARPFDEMLYQVLEHRRVQLVTNLLAVAFGHHETGFPKHGKVPGNRRPAGIESIGDLSRREGSIPQQPKNHPPRLVSEGAECLIGRTHGPVLPCMISKLANYNRGVKNNSCHGPRPPPGDQREPALSFSKISSSFAASSF